MAVWYPSAPPPFNILTMDVHTKDEAGGAAQRHAESPNPASECDSWFGLETQRTARPMFLGILSRDLRAPRIAPSARNLLTGPPEARTVVCPT